MASIRRAFLALLVLSLAIAGVGCPCVRSVVNNSPDIRWFLFSNFGASKICPEMQKRGVPLKMPQFGNASIGRFFPQQCSVQIQEQRSMIVTMYGTGYANMPMVRRVGFSVSMSVEYQPDFRMEENGLWVWGRFVRFAQQPDMRIIGVENPIVNMATKTPAGDVASIIGNGIVASEIGRGFTVVRSDDGDDFAIGHLDPPEKPKRQFQPGKDHVLLANDLSEVKPASRDYIGPLEVASSGAALFIRARVNSAQLQFTVVDRAVGENWRRTYETAIQNGPPPGPVVLHGQMNIGDTNFALPVPPGQYYLVVENRAPAPVAALGMPLPFPETISYIQYGIEVGDKP